jgi:Zn-dependent protease with chaperone function
MTFVIHQNASVFKVFGVFDCPEIAFSVSFFLSSALRYAMEPVDLLYSRNIEYRADAFSVSLGYKKGLLDFLIKLANENIVDITTTNFFEFMFLTHPPLDKRIPALMSHIKQ